MPGSIRDRISTFESMASSSIALMPIVPPTPGFSATKKVEKSGVRAKETSRIIPFEYTQRSYSLKDDRNESDKRNKLISQSTRDTSNDDIRPCHTADKAEGDSRVMKQETVLKDEHNSHLDHKNNSIRSRQSGIRRMDLIQDGKINSDTDDSFGDFSSGEEKDQLNESLSSDRNQNFKANHTLNQIDEPKDVTVVPTTKKSPTAVSTLNIIKNTNQKDHVDELDELEKISMQHREIFDGDSNYDSSSSPMRTNEVPYVDHQIEEFQCDNDDNNTIYDDDVSDLLGVNIEEESTVSIEQDPNVQNIIRPQARHFNFDERLTLSEKLFSIQEVAHSMLEKDDYGPKKVLTPRRNENSFSYDVGIRTMRSNSCDDLVSQLTDCSIDAQKIHLDRKWRTSLDDLNQNSKFNAITTTGSEHSSLMTYDLGDCIEENIMIPKHETKHIFRQRNSLAGIQKNYSLGSDKIDVSESMVSEITNPIYEKSSGGMMQSISESKKSSEKEESSSFEIGCKYSGDGSSHHDKFDRSNVVIIRARRGRSRRQSESSLDNPEMNMPKSHFSLRSLSPFRRNRTKESDSQIQQNKTSPVCDQNEKDNHMNRKVKKRRSFSLRSLSPFRRKEESKAKKESTISKRKSKQVITRSNRHSSPLHRRGVTPNDILMQDEDDENSIPLLDVASSEEKCQEKKFSFRTLSPLHRRRCRK